jgi:pimeloyl-ACP methyl ester carboxylesterase
VAVPQAPKLGLASRALLGASIAGDLASRTLLASVISGAMTVGVLGGAGADDARRLEFYAALADERDRDAVFIRPPADVRVRSTAGRPPGVEGGRTDVLRFDTPYVALNPAVRAAYAGHPHNNVARAQHWRHESGPRPTLCVIHGFGASPAWFNSAFFSLEAFFAQGWDVLLHTLPFHGSRRGQRPAFNGVEMFSHGFAQWNEAILHGVYDFRILVDYLERTGAPLFGVTGLSLGGYISAVLAAVEPRLAFVVPNAPVVSIDPLLASWYPANLTVGLGRRVRGVSRELMRRSFAVHSPLNYVPIVPRERLMIIGGLGDRLSPPEQSVLLWEHWGHPALHWFPGNHVAHFGRRGYLAEMRALMDDSLQEAALVA